MPLLFYVIPQNTSILILGLLDFLATVSLDNPARVDLKGTLVCEKILDWIKPSKIDKCNL